ncbi:CNH domain-containing protein [Mycena rosella]|uniref:CNH domain-containing protein n=1 Tax=Mycena rosella TaxID=1033263 RepID=A0AAD7DSS0_MYCRO|nr:CNH domain-containing protein [Mycena rosella]
MLPVEVLERIIDFLHADKAALISCSLARRWTPRSSTAGSLCSRPTRASSRRANTSAATSSSSRPSGRSPARPYALPRAAHSVHIWNKTIDAALRPGFQCVDPLSLVTFPVPVGPAPLDDPPRKPRAMFRVDERFLLCYDRCAFFMDKAGSSSERAFALRWADAAKQFALHYPYLLAFTGAGMHAWRVDLGARVQTVHGAGIRLLAAAPRIVVKLGDGRVVALGCADPEPGAAV